jgi:hypothetical protein
MVRLYRILTSLAFELRLRPLDDDHDNWIQEDTGDKYNLTNFGFRPTILENKQLENTKLKYEKQKLINENESLKREIAWLQNDIEEINKKHTKMVSEIYTKNFVVVGKSANQVRQILGSSKTQKIKAQRIAQLILNQLVS